jgi:hypothetical protein
MVMKTLLLALGLWVTTGIPLFECHSPAKDDDGPENEKRQLSVLARFEGTWVAQGDGFSSTLQYEWALPNVLLRGRNELRNDAGKVIGQYEGHYVWDPDQSKIVFWTVGRDGELHRGSAIWRAGQLWHEATVSGGRIKGYRSVLDVVEGELHFRAKFQASATDEEVRNNAPLIYRKVPRQQPESPGRTP